MSTHTHARFGFTALVLLLLALPAVFGCGPSDRTVPVFPVAGSVKFQGKAPAGATILLSPLGKHDVLIAPQARVKDDGSYRIGTFAESDGAPPGEYVATVQWFKPISDGGGSGPGPNVLPAKYSKPDTSPLKVTIKAESNTLPEIVID